MANINISDISPVGFNLLSDSESYLNELKKGEAKNVLGGSPWYGGGEMTGPQVAFQYSVCQLARALGGTDICGGGGGGRRSLM